MPQYKTHTRFNLLLALPLLVWGLHSHIHTEVPHNITFCLAFIYGTLFMSPDMDLAHKIRFFSLRGILAFPFRLYARFFKHRGISHSLFWGTLTRLLWLSAFIIGCTFFLYEASFPKESFFSFLARDPRYGMYGFLGLFFADFFHVLLDRLKSR